MSSSKTEKLNLNIGYNGTSTVKNWRDGLDENFEILDQAFNDIVEAIAKAEEQFSKSVDLDE